MNFRLLNIFVFLIALLISNAVHANVLYDSNIFAPEENEELVPFGSNLFSGQFSADKNSGLNSNYIIQPGDQISISTWGEVNENKVQAVDNQGNIFIPNIGPIKVGGLPNSQLNEKVSSSVKKVFPIGVNTYSNLVGSNPVSIFVTGAVTNPGSYSGTSTDSLLHYIDKAGGINQATGSFRNVTIKRNGSSVEYFDIYGFLTNGEVPATQLRDGDVIMVGQKGLSVAADGEIRNKNIFEFTGLKPTGSDLINIAGINAGVTHVSISGFRGSKPVSRYFTLEDFKTFQLSAEDNVTFHSTAPINTIKVFVEGEHLGPSVLVAPNDTTLLQVLSQVKVDPDLANYNSVRVEREEVAFQQKVSLENSLSRLEQVAFTTQTADEDELKYKASESLLIKGFIENARKAKPKGTIVVSTNGKVKDIKLKDGDKIIIPSITNIVMVSGEVSTPAAVVFNPKMSYKAYISKAGGLTPRGDEDNIIVLKASGESIPARSTDIEEGDEIIVLPEIKIDRLSLASKIMDVIYKLVLSVAVPIKLIDD